MTRAGARVQRGAHLVSSLFQFLTLWLHLWGATRGRWLREMDGPSDTKSLPEMGAPCQLHRLT